MARKKRATYEAHGIDMAGAAWENMSKEQLAALAAHEAKIANQRMRRLEAAGYGGDSPASGAYKVVKSDISRRFPEAAKFSESANVYGKMRVSKIKAILRDLEYYKTLKTATVSGTKRVMRNRRKGFENKTGIRFSSQAQFDRFFKLGVGKFLFGLYGSDTAIDFINNSKRSIDEITAAVRTYIAQDTGDKDNADQVAQLLGYQNLADARRKTGQEQQVQTQAQEETQQAQEEAQKGGRRGRRGKR